MVSISKDKVENLLKSNFDRGINVCQQDDDCTLLDEFLGNINEVAIGQISDRLEEKLSTINLSKILAKKSFTILIEGLQNIYKHALKDDLGHAIGGYLLTNSSEKIQLHFLNLVRQELVSELASCCDRLNLMSHDEVKVLYLDTLANAEVTDKGGASLGCMFMKLKSQDPLIHHFELVEKDISCFHLIVTMVK